MVSGVKQDEKVRKVHVTMYPAEEQAARELAERSHGGNVSHLIRTLILREYRRMTKPAGETERVA